MEIQKFDSVLESKTGQAIEFNKKKKSKKLRHFILKNSMGAKWIKICKKLRELWHPDVKKECTTKNIQKSSYKVNCISPC